MKRLFATLRYAALDQNGILVQLLGLFPAVVLSTRGKDGLIMGLFITLVLIFTSFFTSLFRKAFTDGIRLLVIVLISSTVSTVLSLVTKALLPTLFSQMQIFFEMLCVTGIIFARSEIYARFKPAAKSVFDALGTGIGVTAVLFILGLLREFFGAGTLFSGTPLQIKISLLPKMDLFLRPAGGLLMLGVLVAIFRVINEKIKKMPEREEEEL